VNGDGVNENESMLVNRTKKQKLVNIMTALLLDEEEVFGIIIVRDD
jgi:hypothetical protein